MVLRLVESELKFCGSGTPMNEWRWSKRFFFFFLTAKTKRFGDQGLAYVLAAAPHPRTPAGPCLHMVVSVVAWAARKRIQILCSISVPIAWTMVHHGRHGLAWCLSLANVAHKRWSDSSLAFLFRPAAAEEDACMHELDYCFSSPQQTCLNKKKKEKNIYMMHICMYFRLLFVSCQTLHYIWSVFILQSNLY